MKNKVELQDSPTISSFANYIIEHCFEHYCEILIDYFDEHAHGKFPEYDKLPYATKLETTKAVHLPDLESLSAGNYEDQIEKDLDKYKNDLAENSFVDFDLDFEGLQAFCEMKRFGMLQIIDEMELNELTTLQLQREVDSVVKLYTDRMVQFLARTKDQAFKFYRHQYAEIDKALRYAHNIQSMMLTAESDLSKNELDGFIYFRPKEHVSGDFYHIQPCSEGTYIIVSDCTGHGIPAALLTVLGLNLVQNSLRLLEEHSLDYIMNVIDERFRAHFHNSHNMRETMDMTLLFIPKDQKTVQYIAANSNVYLKRGEEIIKLENQRKPVGSIYHEGKFRTREIALEPNDCLFMQSDGYKDQFGGPRGKSLRSKGYRELLSRLNIDDFKSNKTKLNDFFEEWMGKEEQIDDVVVMGLKF